METPVNHSTRTTDDLIMCATDSEVEMLRNQFLAASFIYRLGFHNKQYLNAHKPGHDHNTREYFNYAKKYFNYVCIGDILKILKCIDDDYEKRITYTGPSLSDFGGTSSLALYSNCKDPFGEFIKNSYSYYLYTLNRAHDGFVDTPIQVYIRFPYSTFRVFRKELEYSSDEHTRILSTNGVFNDIDENLIDVLPRNIEQFDSMYDITRTSTGQFNGFGHTINISSLYMSIILSSDNLDYHIDSKTADQLSVVSISPLLISRRCSNLV